MPNKRVKYGPIGNLIAQIMLSWLLEPVSPD